MWRVPQGVKVMVKANDWREGPREIARPMPTKAFINNEWHRVKPYHDGTHLDYGIKPIRQQGYDSENYTATPTEDETATEIVKGWTNPQPKMSVANRKKAFDVFLKTLGASCIQTAKHWINDYFGELDNSNPKKAEWQQYITDLKAAYQTIRSEALPLDYDTLVAYIKCEPDPETDGWRKHIPDQPDPE